MKIKNLRLADADADRAPVRPAAEPHNSPAANGSTLPVAAGSAASQQDGGSLAERQSLEIAMLKARIQHLELVVETARSLMGSNQERLLRRLHEVPRELAALGAQLRRIDPHAVW